MIDEKKLIEDIIPVLKKLGADDAREVMEVIKSQHKVGKWVPCSERLPKVETEPAVHGEWILKDDHGRGVCSNCHRQDKIDPLAGFCRYCGAKMDGGVNHDIAKGN